MNLIKLTIQKMAHRFGYDIVRSPRMDDSSVTHEYETVHPAATYSPWNNDMEFQNTFASIAGFTLVDKYRCFELWKLVEQSSKLKTGHIIEVGVWRGGTGALMARQAKRCGIDESVFLCDTFQGVVKAGAKDSSYKGGEHADTSRQTVEELGNLWATVV